MVRTEETLQKVQTGAMQHTASLLAVERSMIGSDSRAGGNVGERVETELNKEVDEGRRVTAHVIQAGVEPYPLPQRFSTVTDEPPLSNSTRPCLYVFKLMTVS